MYGRRHESGMDEADIIWNKTGVIVEVNAGAVTEVAKAEDVKTKSA